MKISCLNVGHGDSIVVEWKEKEKLSIGIIDCCNYSGRNKTIEFLETKKNLSEIEFIVLTHPHIDHYSGFTKLFEYIKDNGIIIKNFIHSLHGDPKYLNWVETKDDDRKKLQEILDLILDFHDNKKIIQEIQWAINGWTLVIGEIFEMKAISPSDSEVRTRISKIKYYEKENRFLCSSSSNYLSTILIIKNKVNNKWFLLTSDALDYSFERLSRKNLFKEKKLSGTQIPHHGSSKSLFKQFWKDVFLDEEKIGLISSGFNEKYKLPDYNVVKYFNELGLDLRITNVVHGFKEFVEEYNEKVLELMNAIDDDSEPITDNYIGFNEIVAEL